MKKGVRKKKRIYGIGSIIFLMLISFLVYQGYWFIRDFGKNKYHLKVEKYIQPELKEQIGVLLEVEIKEPKKETIVLKSKQDQVISPESLEGLDIEGLKILSGENAASDGVKIEIEKSDKTRTFKLPIPIAQDSQDTIEIYREGRKIKSTKINYSLPKEKQKKSRNTALASRDNLYATTGAVAKTNTNYDMFHLPLMTQLQNFNPSKKKIVYNYQELIDALKDSSIDDIEFGANISGTAELPKINRSLRIDGKNFTFSSTATSNANRTFRLERTKTPRTFAFVNMKVDIRNSSGLIQSDNLLSNDNEWVVLIENVSNTYRGEIGSFINIPRASLVMKGIVNWVSGTRTDDVINATEILITDGAKVDLTGERTTIRLYPQNNSINTTFVAEKGSVLNIHSRKRQAIYANVEGSRNRVYFEARDQETVVNATSNGNETGAIGATISLCGASNNSSATTKSLTQVTAGAKINVHSLGLTNNKQRAQPAMINQVTDSNFHVDGEGSELNLISEGEGNNIGAVLRFRLVGGQTFLIKNKGKVTIDKRYGEASGVRLYGQNNQFLVQAGGNLSINNQADKSSGGRPTNGGDLAGKQGVQFPVDGSGRTSVFAMEGKGSEVYIKADLGPALWTQYGNLRFLIGKETIFRAEGTTNSQTSGIVQSAGTASFEIDQPRFYDLRNNRSNGGQVFSSGTNSGTFEANKSYLSVWEIKNNVDLDKDPDAYWAPISYKLTGSHFERIVSTDYPNEFNTSTYKGANRYSRMSGNGSAPTVDELRVPTNADKTIYGHVSVKVGYGDEMRDAWEDEVWVTVQVKRDGKILSEEVLSTKGINNDLPGVKQWDEDEARGGIFVLDRDDFLRTGDTVEVIGAHRGRKNEVGEASEEKETILVKPVTTVDVTPPQKLTVTKDPLAESSSKITNATKQIKGTIELYDEREEKIMDEIYLYPKINDQFAKESITKITSEGKQKGDSIVDWTINLPGYLPAGSQIELYAKDRSDIGELQDKDNLLTHTKEPNDLWGNVMPTARGYESYKGYHDAVKTSKKDERFKPATLLTVEDIIPEGLVIFPDSVKSSTKVKDSVTNQEIDITRVGSRLTYTGKIRSEDNLSNSRKVVQNVFAQIVIPEDLAEEELNFTFKKKKISDSEDKAVEVSATYDPVTRMLTTETDKVNLSIEDEILFSFSSIVTRIPEGSPSFSLSVKAQGRSPEEIPFVPGDFIPENQRVLAAEVVMVSPMPENTKPTDPDPIIEDGNAYVRLSVVNKRLTAYYRNVNKIIIKIDGDKYKTYTPQLATAEKSILLDIPIDQHRRNITAEYYYPDPNNAGNVVKKIASWNKDKWNDAVNDALDKKTDQ
ncbi:hypothetical protein JZO66_10020 [Enterococcus sp. DIV0242_7C1]|uniref:Uncharacterized protein n=1 Tax=Candidatus Enterococcus dunnyi TaxID=1834192 RepID=A0A200J9I5_9ENTE|nr:MULTISPECIES: pectate lyase-like adhesive domain-containing protein [unclassified Enterococcus]MBO0470883.1 hypothetical protein [Enterococcus sp. DIV0242_7C1]OUZ33330.1 hypothetical protein A5889_002041 [Enterococcus sp. 9D6_DIV0238]